MRLSRHSKYYYECRAQTYQDQNLYAARTCKEVFQVKQIFEGQAILR